MAPIKSKKPNIFFNSSKKIVFFIFLLKKQKKNHFLEHFEAKNLNFFDKVLTYTRLMFYSFIYL